MTITTTTTTDADLLDLLKEHHATALLHGDYRSVRQLDRVRANLQNGARLSWGDGDLLIQSVNNPGQVYSVSGSRCTCPNGAAGRSSCWHVALYDLLIELEENRAAAADLLSDAAEARAELSGTVPEMGGLWRALDEAAAVLGMDEPAGDEPTDDIEIQYEDVPYPHGIGNPDAGAVPGVHGCAACGALLHCDCNDAAYTGVAPAPPAAGIGQRLAAARARLAA